MNTLTRFFGLFFADNLQEKSSSPVTGASRRGSVFSDIFSGSSHLSAPVAQPGRGTKRSHEESVDEETSSLAALPVTPAPKRRRIEKKDTVQSLNSDSSVSESSFPASETAASERQHFSSAPTTPPATPPQPSQPPFREGNAKVALGLWIGEYLCDRFSTTDFEYGKSTFYCPVLITYSPYHNSFSRRPRNHEGHVLEASRYP
jgi:hypothetical protein